MIQEFLEVMGTFGSGFLSYLLLEAIKYGKEFSIIVLWQNNIKPILWTLIGSTVVAALSIFLPQAMPFVEQTVGGSVDVTSYLGLSASGAIIGGLIKAAFSNQKMRAAKLI